MVWPKETSNPETPCSATQTQGSLTEGSSPAPDLIVPKPAGEDEHKSRQAGDKCSLRAEEQQEKRTVYGCDSIERARGELG